jgi:N-formylglutamate amidohydrolase
MAATGPPVGPDPGRERPAACLSHADGTCPDEWIASLRDLLAAELGRPVSINDPFTGGYLTRTHAAEMPWLQLELSRAGWISNAEKQRAVRAALGAWCERHAAAG